MARFNAAVMDNASDAKFQNRYNYLLDLLDMGYIVEKRIGGKSIRLAVSPEEGFAFYQGGGPTGWVYRGGLELIGDNLFLTSNAIKGSELSDRYLLWEDDPSTIGSPQLQLYDDDLRVGQLRFSLTDVGLVAYPTGAADYSEINISAAQYTANPEDFASIRLYGNKQASNYAKISVYADVLSGGGNYASYTFTPTGFIATLNGTAHTVWHEGNDGALVKKSEVLYSTLTLSADQTFGTSTSSSVVKFDTETGDCSLDSYGCKVPTGNFIAIVTAWIWWDPNSTGLRFVKIRKNSTDISMQNMNATSSGIALIQASASFAVTTGDIIYAYVYQNSGGDLNLDLNSKLFVTLIPTD